MLQWAFFTLQCLLWLVVKCSILWALNSCFVALFFLGTVKSEPSWADVIPASLFSFSRGQWTPSAPFCEKHLEINAELRCWIFHFAQDIVFSGTKSICFRVLFSRINAISLRNPSNLFRVLFCRLLSLHCNPAEFSLRALTLLRYTHTHSQHTPHALTLIDTHIAFVVLGLVQIAALWSATTWPGRMKQELSFPLPHSSTDCTSHVITFTQTHTHVSKLALNHKQPLKACAKTHFTNVI